MSVARSSIAIATLSLVAAGAVACDEKKDAPKPETSAKAKPATSASAAASAKPKEKSFEERVKESKPLTPSPKEQEVDGKKVTAAVCKIEGKEFLGKSTMSMFKAITVVDDKAYIADGDGQLMRFTIDKGDECKLTLDKDFGADGTKKMKRKVNYLAKDGQGMIYGSSGIFEAYFMSKDGEVVHTCTERGIGHIEPHDSGKWGIGSWVNADVKMIELGKDTCKPEPWVLTDLNKDGSRKGPFKNVNSVGIIGSDIYVGGVMAEKVNNREPRQVVIYDKKGKEKGKFGNAEKVSGDEVFGWVHGIEGCKAGVCVLDSNYRRVSMWKKDGKFVGAVDLKKLFDLSYPWMNDFSVAKDGKAYFVTANDREPRKSGVAQGFVYVVEGL